MTIDNEYLCKMRGVSHHENQKQKQSPINFHQSAFARKLATCLHVDLYLHLFNKSPSQPLVGLLCDSFSYILAKATFVHIRKKVTNTVLLKSC